MYEQGFFDGVADILLMGGYWPYVWPAYLVTAAIMVALVVHAQRAYRRQDRSLTELEARLPAARVRQGTAGSSR